MLTMWCQRSPSSIKRNEVVFPKLEWKMLHLCGAVQGWAQVLDRTFVLLNFCQIAVSCAGQWLKRIRTPRIPNETELVSPPAY